MLFQINWSLIESLILIDQRSENSFAWVFDFGWSKVWKRLCLICGIFNLLLIQSPRICNKRKIKTQLCYASHAWEVHDKFHWPQVYLDLKISDCSNAWVFYQDQEDSDKVQNELNQKKFQPNLDSMRLEASTCSTLARVRSVASFVGPAPDKRLQRLGISSEKYGTKASLDLNAKVLRTCMSKARPLFDRRHLEDNVIVLQITGTESIYQIYT